MQRMQHSLSDTHWNRRQALAALAPAVGLPVLGTPPARRTVGIVGGGMAGVSLAWLLGGKCDVMLLEAAPAIGGNVRTVAITLDGQTFAVDMGAQYFHPALYPTYVTLLGLLGLLREVHSFTASITLEKPEGATPLFVSPVLPGRTWPLVVPWNGAGLQAFAVAFAAAKKREEENGDWNVTVQDWLRTLNLTQQQWEGMVLPWVASLYSGSIEQARGLSARAAMIFAARALPEKPTDPIQYSVLKPGMAGVLRRMVERSSGVEVRTSARVSLVRRAPSGGFAIACTDGRHIHVDEVVFASSGPATLELLNGLPDTAAQRTALQNITFHDATLALHTDPIYASPKADYRSFFNAQIRGAYCEASMWLVNALPGAPAATAGKLWKSWITHRTQLPGQVLALTSFRHMLATPSTLQAQRMLLSKQGQGNVWFVGGYTRPYDSQETALVSAIDVAQRLLA
jgi:uncharacterized protein